MPGRLDAPLCWRAAPRAVLLVAVLQRAAAFHQANVAEVTHLDEMQMMYQQNIHWVGCSNKCLDIAHGATDNGNPIQVWDCFPGEPDQRFRLMAGTQGQIVWEAHPEKCLQVSDDEKTIVLNNCAAGNDKQLFVVPIGGKGQIKWHTDPSKCFDVNEGLTTNGNSVILWDCGDNTINQDFLAVRPPEPAPIFTCNAENVDLVSKADPPMLTVQECQNKCNAVPVGLCECAVYRPPDGRCLLKDKCPKTLPEHFTVDGMEYQVLERGTVVATTTQAATPPPTPPSTAQATKTYTRTSTTAKQSTAVILGGDGKPLDPTSTQTRTTTVTTTTRTTTITTTSTIAAPLLHTTFASVTNGTGTIQIRPWYFSGLPPRAAPGREPEPPGPQPVLMLPHLHAHPVGYGDEVRPGEIIEAVDVKTGSDGVRFLKLAGENRWVPDRQEPGVNVTAIPLQAQHWRHLPVDGKPMKLLSSPIQGSFTTGTILQPDEEFTAVKQIEDGHGTVWLKLQHSSGWAYDRDPVTKQRVCEQVEIPMWQYTGQEPRTLLSAPKLNAPPLATPVNLSAGQSFAVAEQRVSADNIDFLRPQWEEGWVPVRTEDVTLCKPVVSKAYRYSQPGNGNLPIVGGPSPDAPVKGHLEPNEVFTVSEVSTGDDDKKMLKLVDGRGWVPEETDAGKACEEWPKVDTGSAWGWLLWLLLLLLCLLCCCLGLLAALFLKRKQPEKQMEGYRTLPPIKASEASSPREDPKPAYTETAVAELPPEEPEIPQAQPPDEPHLSLTFVEPPGKVEHEFFFTQKPLGFTFPFEAPVVVDGFIEGQAFQQSMRLGMQLTHMGNTHAKEVLQKKYYVGNADYQTVFRALKDAVAMLPLADGSVDYAGTLAGRPRSPGADGRGGSRSPRNGASFRSNSDAFSQVIPPGTPRSNTRGSNTPRAGSHSSFGGGATPRGNTTPRGSSHLSPALPAERTDITRDSGSTRTPR